jgi:hypothetical protein
MSDRTGELPPTPEADPGHAEPSEPPGAPEPPGVPEADGNGAGGGDGSWPPPPPGRPISTDEPGELGGDHEQVVDDPERERRRRQIRRAVDAVVLAACVVFVLLQIQPSMLISDTTPAGGDMGAHVWGPAYLRDQLLPNLQLAGWTPDWYAGFPAYQFYMVVPSLAIVALNAGIHGPLALLPAAVGAGLVTYAVLRRDEPRVRIAAVVGAVIALTLVGLPYGVAFKWVSVSGLLTLPVAAYAFGRLSGFRFPTPAVLAVATLPFLFYRGFTIYGGNVASTLAGEFAFSMALSLAVVYLGLVMRGLETGKYRGWTAVLLALTGLCHLIVAFWALGATAVIVVTKFRRSRSPWEPCVALVAIGIALGLGAMLVGPLLDLVGGLPIQAAAGLGLVAIAAGLWLASESVRWLTPVMVVGGLLSSFWVGPFYLRRAYLNDMGWEKLPYVDQTIWQHLFPSKTPDVDLRWAFGLALLGAVVCLVRRMRAGIFLAVVSVAVGVAFVVIPEGRLWNGRLLPFYYLTVLLLAGVAVAETAKIIARRAQTGRPRPLSAGVPTAIGALLVTLVLVGLPLGALPFDERADAGFDWPSFSPVKTHAQPESFIPSWAKWNYSGYEEKDAYREYHDVVRTMQQVGQDHGCGRAFWEYEKELDRYGTPMALMLLPHWTDGCIGSMEGLYFEASSTTPFHFLTQVELSTAPSAAQRDLPYGTFDIARGVEHLQMLGVRYYMATTDQAVAAARQQPELTEVAGSPPWVVFQVADSPLVQPLDNEPAVLTDVDDSQAEWLEEPLDDQGRFGGPAVRWFTDPTQWDVPLATRGPSDWQRIVRGQAPERRPVEPARVSNVDVGRESLSFDVDRVGTPVLVKMSYFPNWQVSGAEGPYRVTPNLMVVVPTSEHVSLTYGRTWVEYVSYTATLLGIAGLVMLARRGAYRFRPAAARPEGRAWFSLPPRVSGAPRQAGTGTPSADDVVDVEPGDGTDPPEPVERVDPVDRSDGPDDPPPSPASPGADAER